LAFWQPQVPIKTGVTDIESVRARYEASFARFGAPETVAVVPGSLGPIAGEWHKSGDDSRVLLYFHGGGFMLGTLALYDTACRRLARQSGCAAAGRRPAASSVSPRT